MRSSDSDSVSETLRTPLLYPRNQWANLRVYENPPTAKESPPESPIT